MAKDLEKVISIVEEYSDFYQGTNYRATFAQCHRLLYSLVSLRGFETQSGWAGAYLGIKLATMKLDPTSINWAFRYHPTNPNYTKEKVFEARCKVRNYLLNIINDTIELITQANSEATVKELMEKVQVTSDPKTLTNQLQGISQQLEDDPEVEVGPAVKTKEELATNHL